MNEGFDEVYGKGGLPGGGNIAFTVSDPLAPVRFFFDGGTKILRIDTGAPAPVPLPASLLLLGGGLASLVGLRRNAPAGRRRPASR